MGQYISDYFFHFVGHRDPNDHAGNYVTLKSILESKLIRRPGAASQHGISIRRDLAESLRSGKLIVPDMVCLADIPKDHLAIHASKYGYFGIGLEKHHCILYGARPVTYIPMLFDNLPGPRDGEILLNDIDATYRAFLQYFVDPSSTGKPKTRTLGKIESKTEAVDSLKEHLEMNFIGFLKPYDSWLADNHPDNYYTEREWRCLIDVGFEFKHVAVVSIHKDFKERLSKDFPELDDRIYVMG